MESATRIFEALAGDYRWTLMTNRMTSRTDRWRSRGAQVVHFDFHEKQTRLFRSAQLLAAATRALTIRADILHGNDIRGVQVLLPAARVKRLPLAFTLRDTKPPGEHYGRHWQTVARNLDALIMLSDDMARREGDRLLVPYQRRYTINSLIDLEAFQPLDPVERIMLRKQLNIRVDEFAVGMVAGVFEKKQQLDVIRYVLPNLNDLPLRLHLVGDYNSEGAYAKACKDTVKSNRLCDRVVFHGFSEDIAKWLVALDVVLVASRTEGLARCMIEAMACGTPVISTDVCSASEMLGPTGAGVVVGTNDWQGLAHELRELYIEPRKREAMGQAGRMAALSRFSGSKVADEWRAVYNSLVAFG